MITFMSAVLGVFWLMTTSENMDSYRLAGKHGVVIVLIQATTGVLLLVHAFVRVP